MSTRGHAVRRSTFNPWTWKPALRRIGRTTTRADGMHGLRHTYASLALENGVSIRALAETLGHADPGFTLRVYTHLLPTSDAKVRSAIDAALRRPHDGPTAAGTGS